MGVNTVRHRRRLPVRDLISGLILVLVLWYSRRRARRASAATTRDIGVHMGHLPLSAVRIPLVVSYEEHARRVREMEDYLNGAGAPVA